MKTLTDLPNIGATLVEKLKNAGISTPEQLNVLGAEQTFLRLSIDDESACFNMLCALEGAIQGIRWHNLPKERKEELKEFLRIKKI
ncbi:MAG: TfoX/Sxy family protein [Prolixibacteraceae bacterium]|nr:TfoX/Sxy family protein [Prolixibacteraceae bacterium]MBN2775670.1 TfoX/Sxy family protein [Prolixibacteraceae bacterium]